MKILDWNVYYKNKSLDNLLRLIDDTSPDIVCLQEVPGSWLEYFVGEDHWNEAYCVDFGIKKESGFELYYNLTLANETILEYRVSKLSKLKTNSLVSKLSGWYDSREYIKAHLQNGMCVYNIHLESATNPQQRIREFCNVLETGSNQEHALYCGDFNIFGRWYVNIFIGGLYGFKREDYTIHERAYFEKLFCEHNLMNHFYNQITYPSLRLQFDHIVTSQEEIISSKRVIQQKYGSDHYPIMLDVHT